MKESSMSKPKPVSQHELMQYEAQADGAAEAAKSAKQRLRKAKAAVKAARAAHREAKRLAAEARGAARSARKYYSKHGDQTPQPAVPTRRRTRKKAASIKPAKVPPIATGPVPLSPEA